MLKVKNLKLARTITECVIKGTLGATAWVLITILEMGAMSAEVFLKPSVYGNPYMNFLDSFEGGKIPTKKKKRPEITAIRQSLWRLRKQGFVEKKEGKYFLTKKGKSLMRYVLNRKRSVSKKWDGKYRVVIFDIPEKESKKRSWLRQELYLLGYQKLQKSVFIGKHPLPADLIKEIKTAKIGNYVNYLLAEKAYKNIL